uniref:Ricin B lectin domain-containing protein n=1 Tax=Alexandrium catenella TaxID=2925 RepID=A0A7S1S8D9_ALECA|mmetsp:Transcript_89658/g.238168  ORF Transcript_89658/g.238168 Transcript_89658/m.238168 type:complete len:262 (+) Transcript_89658:68-853(+)
MPAMSQYAMLATLAIVWGGARADTTAAALAADDSCLSARCALNALQKSAGRAAEAQASEVWQSAADAGLVCGDREGGRGSCAVRLFVGGQGGQNVAAGADAGRAALVQVLAAGQPIPTTDGLYPHTGCLEVFDAGSQLLPLKVSPCQAGVSAQEFEFEPSKFRILYDVPGGPKLCLTSFLHGATTLVGFGPCNADIDSINNFNQTFQFVGRSMGAVCQCRCVNVGPCPIPCAFNAACLHTQPLGPVQNIVLASPEQFWNRR